MLLPEVITRIRQAPKRAPCPSCGCRGRRKRILHPPLSRSCRTGLIPAATIGPLREAGRNRRAGTPCGIRQRRSPSLEQLEAAGDLGFLAEGQLIEPHAYFPEAGHDAGLGRRGEISI